MRIVWTVLRGLGLAAESVAKTIGAMSEAHTHDLDSQRALYRERRDHRP
ncbi:hypothetical protein [Curtobacterium sp. MCBD17_032]|nr:hypothetical protein [Curtobacterium sp. MCBD17_032]